MADARRTNGRRDGQGAEDPAPRPLSRARQIASRSDGTPTPEVVGALAFNAALDVVGEALEPRVVSALCRGLQTTISAARNAAPLDDLCDRMAMQRREEEDRQAQERAERVRELEAELARLRQ